MFKLRKVGSSLFILNLLTLKVTKRKLPSFNSLTSSGERDPFELVLFVNDVTWHFKSQNQLSCVDKSRVFI